TTDGSWGEGLGYNNYTFSNLSYSVPSLKNVFHIDVSQPLAHTYNQYIWGGMLDKKQWFEFGDSGGDMAPATNWAFLLGLSNDPRLAWYYNYLKKDESIEDVLYDTKDIKQSDPFQEDPVKAFHKIGTTVFKSGWEKDGFTFVMRTGAFFNHQHLDQGSFWLADKGVPIIEERHLHNSDYYDDPLYQSHLIQPIAHSTILINGNEQSQRIGDDYKFAPGFEDHAFLADFLNGKDAAFSRGDIGRLYWGKIKSLTRNVLYLKPRTLIMLDEAVPGEKDVDVTLLYQTAQLGDIKAGQKQSTITKEGVKLNILHLTPDITETKAVETPHYLKTLLKERPLVKEGMLTVTAHTSGRPLIIANLLTTTDAGAEPDVKYTTGNGYVEGVASGQKFAFSTQPGSLYQVGGMKTDALCITWSAERIFVAQAMSFRRDDGFFVTSNIPFTFELAGEKILYNHGTSGKVRFGFAHTPKSVRLNGTIVKGIV
ncbi:MAG TPA: heparinase II/III family protein, partial [Flavisolibacter sp.]|nr:heparinase II/III family protein [Flavisolibacter sp.]